MDDAYNSVVELEDFCLISYLALSGFAIESINPKSHLQFTFMFKKTKSLDEAMASFHNNTSLVEPKMFFAKIRELKARISIKN